MKDEQRTRWLVRQMDRLALYFIICGGGICALIWLYWSGVVRSAWIFVAVILLLWLICVLLFWRPREWKWNRIRKQQ